MLEFEKKLMLTRQEYDYLRDLLCKNVPSVFQTNYYFDTNDFSLNQKGITCRIRYKNGKYETTVKSHYGNGTDCSAENFVSVKNEFDVNTFKDTGIILQGSLFTERSVIYKDEYCEAVLDRNVYFGITDYELEIEYLQKYGGCVDQLLCEIADKLSAEKFIDSAEEFLARTGLTKNKSQRFFERKNILLEKSENLSDIHLNEGGATNMDKANKEGFDDDLFKRDQFTWRRMAEFFWSNERDPRVPLKKNDENK